jgi:hypothetical protein
VVGASVPGARALRAGAACEDTFRHGTCHVGDREALVLVVADGAGAAPRAAEGAAMAVGVGYAELVSRLERSGVPDSGDAWHALLQAVLGQVIARVALAAEALSEPGAAPQFASTLLATVHAPPWVCSISVGDGMLAVRRSSGSVHLLPAVATASRWVNATTFLTSAGAVEGARIMCVRDPDVDAIAAATDGVAALASGGEALVVEPGFLEPLLAHAAASKSSAELATYLLGDPGIAERTADDRTLVIGVRQP